MTKMTLSKQIIGAGMLGTALEFYDFALFGILTPVLGPLFFPMHLPNVTLLWSLGTFAAGFFMRPLGGLLFGFLGDRFGRRRALSLSILALSVPTGLIALMPTYAQIGLWAPTLLILCRLAQGLCVGGEHNGAAIFVIEHSPLRKKGVAGTLILLGLTLGTIAATLIGALVTLPSLPPFLWRLAFLLGTLVGVIGLYIRRSLPETPDFQSKRVPAPWLKLFKEHKAALSQTFLIGGFSGALAYTLIVYVQIYLITVLQTPKPQALLWSTCGLLIASLCQFLAGWFSDHWEARSLMKLGIFVTLIGSVPMYLLLNAHHILPFQILLGIMIGLFNGPMHGYLNTLFPVSIRYRGIAFFFSLGMACFGGTAPIASAWLREVLGVNWAPALWLMGIGTLTAGGMMRKSFNRF